MSVSVRDMHTKALGIDGIDISTQEGAKAAVDKIKAAINSVSSTRGEFGCNPEPSGTHNQQLKCNS